MAKKKKEFLDDEILGEKIEIEKKTTKGLISVTPKEDFRLVDGYNVYDLKTGKDIEIPSKFRSSLETEKII